MAYAPVNVPKKEIEKVRELNYVKPLRTNTYTCFYQINVELQKLNARQNEMETTIKDATYVCEEIMVIEEKLDDRTAALEEEVESLKVENNELRKYVNTIVEELNAVITLLNTRYEVKNLMSDDLV